LRKDPWIFGWIFFESLRRQRTKFTHFALVTFAQYCTRHFGLSKPFDPILKSWNLCDKSQSLILVFLCVLESKITLNSQSFSDRGLDISIFLGFYFFFFLLSGANIRPVFIYFSNIRHYKTLFKVSVYSIHEWCIWITLTPCCLMIVMSVTMLTTTTMTVCIHVNHIYSNKRCIWDKKVNKRCSPDVVLI